MELGGFDHGLGRLTRALENKANPLQLGDSDSMSEVNRGGVDDDAAGLTTGGSMHGRSTSSNANMTDWIMLVGSQTTR